MNIPECVKCGILAAFPLAVTVPYTCLSCLNPEQPQDAAPDEAKGGSLERIVSCEQVLAAIEAEPEMPGDMPDEMWAIISKDRDAAAECLRIVVRQTKAGIIRRLNL